MEEKTIRKTVYIAKDGKEFLDKEECEKYEKEFLDKVSYFAIAYNFDLTEGRGFKVWLMWLLSLLDMTVQ